MLAIAHRGFSARYPENTCLAVEKAVDAGADLVETDLRLSRDGFVVCCHDATLERIAGRGLAIAESDLRALQAVPLPQGQRIATLAEVLDLTHGRIPIVLDLKDPDEELLDRLLGSLACFGAKPDVFVGIRSIDQYDVLLGRSRNFAVVAFVKDDEARRACIERGVDVIRLWEDELSPERERMVRDAGRKLWVTAGRRSRGEAAGDIDGERVLRLLDRGVDGLLLNDPTLVVTARAERAIKKGS